MAEDFKPRDRATHSDHCRQLAGLLRHHCAVASGVKRDSVLNQLRYFHVTESVPPDIMNDCLEGSLMLEMKVAAAQPHCL